MAQQAPNKTQVPPSLPISAQPSSSDTTALPTEPNAFLTSIEHLDEVFMKKDFPGGEDHNRNVLLVENSQGQPLWLIEENNAYYKRTIQGKDRPFEIEMKDLNGSPHMKLERPLRRFGFCLPCLCRQEMKVESPPGTVIGYVKENWNVSTSSFKICDAEHNELFKVTGAACADMRICCSNINFEVTDAHTSQPVGKLSKTWSGLMQGICSDSTSFRLTFPKTMPVQQKSLILSLALLVNFMHFEKEAQDS